MILSHLSFLKERCPKKEPREGCDVSQNKFWRDIPEPSPLETPPLGARLIYSTYQDLDGRAKLHGLPCRGCWSESEQGAVLFREKRERYDKRPNDTEKHTLDRENKPFHSNRYCKASPYQNNDALFARPPSRPCAKRVQARRKHLLFDSKTFSSMKKIKF